MTSETTTWERAAYVRMLSGRTQTEIAAALELEAGQLADYESGMVVWPDARVARLADALGISDRVLTSAEMFAAWLGDRALPPNADGSVLGIPSNPSPMRLNDPVFKAISAASIEDLNYRVNDFLAAYVQPDAHLLMVSPVTVAPSDDNGNRLYIVSIVYAVPEAFCG